MRDLHAITLRLMAPADTFAAPGFRGPGDADLELCQINSDYQLRAFVRTAVWTLGDWPGPSSSWSLSCLYLGFRHIG